MVSFCYFIHFSKVSFKCQNNSLTCLGPHKSVAWSSIWGLKFTTSDTWVHYFNSNRPQQINFLCEDMFLMLLLRKTCLFMWLIHYLERSNRQRPAHLKFTALPKFKELTEFKTSKSDFLLKEFLRVVYPDFHVSVCIILSQQNFIL